MSNKLLTISTLIAASILSLALVSTAIAEDKKAKDAPAEVEENIKKGTIASTGSFNHGNQLVESNAYDGSIPGGETSVISAGVSRKSGGKCQVTVTNTSPTNSYSIGYRVNEMSQSGKKIHSKYLSASLSPQESKSRDISCNKGSRMEVVLSRAKKK